MNEGPQWDAPIRRLLTALVGAALVLIPILIAAGVFDGGGGEKKADPNAKTEEIRGVPVSPNGVEAHHETVADLTAEAEHPRADPPEEAPPIAEKIIAPHDHLGSPVPGPSEAAPEGTGVAEDPEVRAEVIKLNQERAEQQTRPPPEELPETLATPKPPGGGAYRTFSVVNQSARGGCKPTLFILHFTVSPNRPGIGDVLGIVTFFDRSSTQASSTYVADADGNVAQLMSELAKPWTQGFFNCWSVSVEMIGFGAPSDWTNAVIKNAAWLAARTGARFGIPMRRARTSGCSIVLSGVGDHDQLGCQNDHTDVTPNFPWALFFQYAQFYASGGAEKKSPNAVLWKGERRSARCLTRERKAWPRAGTKAKRRASINRAKKCKAALRRSDRNIHRHTRGKTKAARAPKWRAHRRGPRHRRIHAVLAARKKR